MRNGLCLGMIAALILSARSVDAQVPSFYRGPAPAYSALVRAALGALLSRPAFLFTPQADGGGSDGGGGGDGGSSDGSSSDGTGDSADGGEAAAAAAAAAAADAAAAQDAPAVSDPSTDPTTIDPIAVTPEESPLDAIQAIPTTDPRGEEAPIPGSTNSDVLVDAGGSVPIPRGALSAPVDVEIDAVIVSGANSPWGAVQRAPGVRNVTVVGGIIALGKTPLPGEPPPGSPQPAWLRVVPDLRLVDGSVIPPVVPNIIDIRWLNCPIEVIENPPK
jgi:hypothetical protein